MHSKDALVIITLLSISDILVLIIV